MARSTLSFGMLLAFASATAARSRGLAAGSPPPRRAATVISLMMRVKTLPRLASAAPFLCLIVLHLLWPDIGVLPLRSVWKGRAMCRHASPVRAADYIAASAFGRHSTLDIRPSTFNGDLAPGVERRVSNVECRIMRRAPNLPRPAART